MPPTRRAAVRGQPVRLIRATVVVGTSVHTAQMLMSQKFLTNHPFAELLDLGYRLEQLGAPVVRAGADEFVRVGTFGRGEQGISVDVDRLGHMSQFATYAAGDEVTLIAETGEALLALAASPHTASAKELSALEDVTAYSGNHL